MSQREQFVWVEKYRPKTLADCILPKDIHATLTGVLTQKNFPNLLFTGRAGVGKTTVAKALCRDLDVDTLVINASDENGIAVLRDRIKDFATGISFDGKRKYVLLDEADHLNAQSTQPALRAYIEETALNCGFIFTANYRNRIIEPLQSRCSLVDFRIPAKERGAIAVEYAKRIFDILKAEGVTFKKEVVTGVVNMYFPDFRRILNELQRYSASGELSEAVLSQLSSKDTQELFAALKQRDFTAVRKWVGNHEDIDDSTFYRMMFEQVQERLDPASVAQIIVLLADYSYRSALAADKVLNQTACLLEIMHEAKFK